MKNAYEAPAIRDLGSLEELTEQPFNKVGHATDTFTSQTAGVVIGSLVPAP